MPAVSILLPTHNRADVIGYALQSVLAQSWTDWELLVVGDGCRDRTAEVVQGFADPRVIWLDLPKAPGFGYANRNVALRQARGEIIAYMAHDDLWFPDHLAQLVGCLEEAGAELAYSLPTYVSTRGEIEPMVFNLNDARTWTMWHERLLGYLNMASVIHRRACLERYGYWNEKQLMAGDWEMWMRIAQRAPVPNFVYWPVTTCLHFVADWRRWGETRARAWWRRLRQREALADSALQLDLTGSASEQAAAWQALSRDPAGWPRAVRRAVQVELDRRGAYYLALSDVLEAGRRQLHFWRTPRRGWEVFRPPVIR